MDVLEASLIGVGLAMDALAVSLALGATGWSCPQQSAPLSTPENEPKRPLPLYRRLPFLSPTPAAPVCAICRPGCVGGCAGASGRSVFTWDKIVLAAALFGLFQAMMPTIGWFASGLCGEIVRKAGRITSGALLGVVAVQMLREGFSNEDSAARIGVCSLRRLIVLSFATSIDALLVGVSYACLGRENITGDVLVIGAVTAAISAAGCVSGRVFGNRFGNRSSILGGLVLLGIAVKIMIWG